MWLQYSQHLILSCIPHTELTQWETKLEAFSSTFSWLHRTLFFLPPYVPIGANWEKYTGIVVEYDIRIWGYNIITSYWSDRMGMRWLVYYRQCIPEVGNLT